MAWKPIPQTFHPGEIAKKKKKPRVGPTREAAKKLPQKNATKYNYSSGNVGGRVGPTRERAAQMSAVEQKHAAAGKELSEIKGTYTKATKQQSRAMTSLGQAWSGLKEGMALKKQDRDLKTADPNYITGYIAGLVVDTASIGKLGSLKLGLGTATTTTTKTVNVAGWTIGESTQIGGVAANTVNAKLVQGVLATKFSPRTLVLLGTGALSIIGASLAYVGLVGTGYWAEAETPEGPSIVVNKFVLPQAIESGDFTLFNEVIAAGDEIMEETEYEKKVKGTPLMYPVEAEKKGKMTVLGWEALKQVGEDAQNNILKLAEKEADEKAEWERIDAREEAQKTLAHERAIQEIDYFNESAIKTANEIARIKAEASTESNKRYRKSLERNLKMQEEAAEKKRQADMDYQIWLSEFWLAYKKIVAEHTSSGSSALIFGLL